jgi:hypothetical protein
VKSPVFQFPGEKARSLGISISRRKAMFPKEKEGKRKI